jgi:protein PhnA
MSEMPPCPKCQSTYVYEDAELYTCPECAHEWPMVEESDDGEPEKKLFYDANGVELKNGDTVTVIKHLKIKGSASSVKIGTKVKNIRLVDGDHDIDCKIPGLGAMALKSKFVRKVN